MATGNIELAQAVGHSRYNLDLEGAFRRAMINQGVITEADKTTGLNGLAHLAAPGLGMPASTTEAYSIMNEIIFALSVYPAP